MDQENPPQLWLIRRTSAATLLRVALSQVVSLAVLAGCTYLVFWRGESGWLYVPALILARLAR